MNVRSNESNSSCEQETGQIALPAQLDSTSAISIPSDGDLASYSGTTKDENLRQQYRWSKAERDLVRANTNVSGKDLSALLTRLQEESGNPRWACRRFVRRMGIKWKRLHRAWTPAEQERLIKLIDLHPINEIAKLMRRSESSIWHMLYRLGANAKMGKDNFTKHTLALALHVRPETIEGWINRSWLKATQIKTGRGKRVIIQAEDFCEFCQRHTKDVVGNRLTQERLDFVYQFVFPPSHSSLLPVRDSKKERNAYNERSKDKFPISVDDESNPEAFCEADDILKQTA